MMILHSSTSSREFGRVVSRECERRRQRRQRSVVVVTVTVTVACRIPIAADTLVVVDELFAARTAHIATIIIIIDVDNERVVDHYDIDVVDGNRIDSAAVVAQLKSQTAFQRSASANSNKVKQRCLIVSKQDCLVAMNRHLPLVTTKLVLCVVKSN